VLKISQGDTAVFQLTAKSAGLPIDLTGAVFVSEIRGPGGEVKLFGNSQHTAAPNQTTNKGQFTLSLSVNDTLSLEVGQGKELITKIVQGANTTYFHGVNILTVLPNVPVQ